MQLLDSWSLRKMEEEKRVASDPLSTGKVNKLITCSGLIFRKVIDVGIYLALLQLVG